MSRTARQQSIGVVVIGIVLAMTTASYAAECVPDTSFLDDQGVMTNLGAWYTQGFSISSTQTFVFRFAERYAASAAILPPSELDNFKNGRAYQGYAIFDRQYGTKTVTLAAGTYYVGIRNDTSGNNTNNWRYELDYDRKVSNSSYLSGRTEVQNVNAGGKLWQPFTMQQGVRLFIDGVNVGLDHFIIPDSELSNFQNNRTFQYYTDYGDIRSDNQPGCYEVTLPPGNYDMVFRNSASLSNSVTYTLEFWSGPGGGGSTPPPAADTAPPFLTITSHSDGQTVSSSSIVLAGTATDSGSGNSGISSVTVNGRRANGDTASGSGTASWNLPISLNPGANLIDVVARDNSSNQNARGVSITINYVTAAEMLAPQLTILSHGNGQTVTTNTITVSGTASDAGRGDSGITSVTVNGVRASGDTASSGGTANWSRTITLNPGNNVIQVVAVDGSRNLNSTSMSITVNYAATGIRPSQAGIFRNGLWLLDANGNGQWDGTPVDRSLSLGEPGDIPVVGDWNGDGRAKIGIFRPSVGLWVLDYNGNGQWDGAPIDRFFYLGQAGDLPVIGDWNGDGRVKAGIFRPSQGLWVLDYNGNGQWDGTPTDRFFYIGQAGDLPVVGDWNGDKRAKAGIFRPSDGLWVLDYNGNGQWDGTPTDRFFFLGQAGDMPVVGDWSGDKRTKAGIFRPSDGLWVLDYNGNGQWDGTPVDRFFTLGQAGDIPVVGDWNGDGRAKAGFFRPSQGLWLQDLNGNGQWDGPPADRFYYLGQSGDVPVIGVW